LDSLNETLLIAEENPDPSFFAMQTYKDDNGGGRLLVIIFKNHSDNTSATYQESTKLRKYKKQP